MAKVKGKKPDVEKEMMAQLHEGLSMRARGKMLEEEAKTLQGEANAKIEMACTLLDIKNYSEEGVGMVTPKVGTNVSINKEKLTAALLELGVDYKVVTEAIDRGTNRKQYTYVEFKRAKV